ncbi:MAG: hypothetical protein U9R72_00885, partial [Chloroflexota bacterium]|nr:hypothetical protein [Chloroflexota bacterium]
MRENVPTHAQRVLLDGTLGALTGMPSDGIHGSEPSRQPPLVVQVREPAHRAQLAHGQPARFRPSRHALWRYDSIREEAGQ